MKKKVIQSKQFSKAVNSFLKKRQLLEEDIESFQRKLLEYPELGELIIGTGGVRKTRLKSSTGGKSGGFRVCYYFITQDNLLFLLLIYAKSVQEDLTAQQKQELKELVTYLKRGTYE